MARVLMPALLLVTLVAMAGCSSGGWHRSTRVPEFTPEEQVSATLDLFHRSAARADEATHFALLSPDSVFLGTDATERWSKDQFRAWAEPYFQRDSAWAYEAIERHITIGPRGEVAWFDEVVRNATYGDLRGTGVLVRDPRAERGTRERGWLIAQYNLTFMVPNEKAEAYLELVRPGR